MRLATPTGDLSAPAQALYSRLHALHHAAGWPSCRKLAVEVGCSRSTIHTAFARTPVARWGLLELIVLELRGDLAELHELWMAATGREGDEQTGERKHDGDQGEEDGVHLVDGAGARGAGQRVEGPDCGRTSVMPARSTRQYTIVDLRRPRTQTPEEQSAEAVERARAVLLAYETYAWQWMLDSENDLADGLVNAEPLQSFLDFIREDDPES
jgi:hypothetical protein